MRNQGAWPARPDRTITWQRAAAIPCCRPQNDPNRNEAELRRLAGLIWENDCSHSERIRELCDPGNSFALTGLMRCLEHQRHQQAYFGLGALKQFAEATERKYAGQQTQMGGTLGVDQSAEKGLAIVKELNAIMIKKLRKTDPVLLGVWQAASRLEQPPRRTTATATTTPLAEPTTTLRAESAEPHHRPPIGLERTAPSVPGLPNKPDIGAANRPPNQIQTTENRFPSGTSDLRGLSRST
jgi:hypothetical protein